MAGYDVEGIEAQNDALRISGRVKWFDAGKGYGFIVPDDPSQTDLKDVLLHVTSLRSSGREHALEGSLITCDVVRRPKGWQVAEVVELDESSAPPAPERRPAPCSPSRMFPWRRAPFGQISRSRSRASPGACCAGG